jgi:hypothetical protein
MNDLKVGIGVYIKGVLRFLQTLVLGLPGTGKSTLVLNWWREDCYFSHAKVIIDPSGQLAREAYAIARGKAYYLSVDTPISINPMLAPYDLNQISDTIAEALNQVVKLTTSNQELTVKMLGILDEAVKDCLTKGRMSLIAVADYIANLKGNYETRDGLLYRLNHFLKDDRMRPILCGPNPIRWRDFIAEGKSLIVDCHGMSAEKMIFMGTLITLGIKDYFRSTRLDKYPPLALYIDEFHNFINHNFFDILKEGRKYGIASVLATQELATLGRELQSVVLMCGNIICFRVKYDEAFLVGREL